MCRSPSSRRVAVVVLATLLASCAPTHIPPISSAGAAFTPDRDEARLWDEARAEERKLREKATIYRDPLLEDYLEGIVTRLNPPGMAANSRIHYAVTVVEDPTLNAFAYPHGSLYVHTGLLARMENEDQLATVLGHEMSHVEGRHMLRYQRSARNRQIAAVAGAVAASIVLEKHVYDAEQAGHYGTAAATRVLSQVILGLGLQLAVLAAVNGYGRELEREADDGGFRKITAAGYDTREAPKVYQTLLEDHGDAGKAEAFFFGNHPLLAERIQAANAWNATHPAVAGASAGARGQGEFSKRISPVIRDDARLNLELGRLGLAASELDRARSLLPDDPEVHRLRGLLSLRFADAEPDASRKAALEKDAMASFREAIRLDPDRPEAHREAGLLAYRSGDLPAACVELGQFLELDPRSADAPKIRDYLHELRRAGSCP